MLRDRILLVLVTQIPPQDVQIQSIFSFLFKSKCLMVSVILPFLGSISSLLKKRAKLYRPGKGQVASIKYKQTQIVAQTIPHKSIKILKN